MFYPEFTREYIEKIKENPDRYEKDYQRMMETSLEERQLYKQDVIPMTYQGMFFQEDQLKEFRQIIEIMVSIGRKVTHRFLKDPQYRKGFHFDAKTEELILIDPGYSIPVPVGRYDIFYNGDGGFKFCELNTDGSSAMNEDRVLGGLLSDSLIMKEMAEEWTIEPFELFRSLAVGLAEIYRKTRGMLPRTVAIVDFIDKGTTKEFEHFRRVFEQEGFHTLICDPRQMIYKEGRLIGKDVRSGEEAQIDLVYRRVVTSDFVDRMDHCPDFLQAYRDRAFLMLGSFRSQVMHSKLIFKMLSDPLTREILTEEENAFVNRHVPLTRELLTEEDRREIIANKDRYILKPYNLYASQGIYVGHEHGSEEWARMITDLPLNQYIYQEYVHVDRTPIVEFIDGRLEVNDFAHVIGLFLYNERFAGSYTRVGQKGIISGARAYYSAPVFLARRKLEDR